MYCNVLITKPFDHTFTYKLKSDQIVEKGSIVLVPFGKKNDQIGMVYEICKSVPENARNINLKELSNLADYLAMAEYMGLILVVVFVFIMSIVLWNVGLLGGLRRYGEVGLRLAIGEHKSQVYRSMIYESIFVGLTGSVIGTGLGLGAAYWLQIWGWDISSMIKNVTMMYPSVIRAEITSETYYIGFFPGLLSTVFGTALSGIGIYKRQTAQLFKELEV